jgi:hypothetical protein
MSATENSRHPGQASHDDEVDAALEEMKQFEQRDELPAELSEWPSGRAMYLTIDSGSDEPYGVGLTAKLGPAGLEHHEDGSVTIDGKTVEHPEEYKGRPIPNPLEFVHQPRGPAAVE